MSFHGTDNQANSNPLDMPLDEWLASYSSGGDGKVGNPGEKGLQYQSTAKPVTPEPAAEDELSDADDPDEE